MGIDSVLPKSILRRKNVERKSLSSDESNATPQNFAAFNDHWYKEELPHLQKHGAKLISVFKNYVGGSNCEAFRLFEFDSVQSWQDFESKRETTPERRQHRDNLVSRFGVTVERKLFKPIYDDIP